MALQAAATGQKSPAPGANSGQAPPPLAAALTLSLQALMQGPKLYDHTIVQLRRFRVDQGQIVTVRERLQVDADGSDSPPFALTFVGVDGELPDSPLDQKWAHTYGRFADQFYRSGCFRVRDLGKAQQNYTLHHFGTVARANRSAHRVVVFPAQLDKSIWVLEVDTQTFVPLYTAEYDAQFRLLAEIEAETFVPVAQLTTTSRRAVVVVPQPDFQAAKTFMGDPAGMVEPAMAILGEYSLGKVEVSENPLNLQQTLVLSYTDGVDEFFITEAPGTTEFLAGLPSQQHAVGERAPNTIARYRDHAMSVLMFWDEGVSFQVTGRGALRRLDEVARSLFATALVTH